MAGIEKGEKSTVFEHFEKRERGDVNLLGGIKGGGIWWGVP